MIKSRLQRCRRCLQRFRRWLSASDSHTVESRIHAIKEKLGIYEIELKQYEMEIAQNLMIDSIKLNSERIAKLEEHKKNSRYRGKTSSGLWRVLDGKEDYKNLRRRKH